MKPREVSQKDIETIESVYSILRAARDDLRRIGALKGAESVNRATEEVRRAIKSVDGAYRNAQANLARQEREAEEDEVAEIA